MSDDQLTSPSANISDDPNIIYAGFWRRAFATIIDSVIAMIVLMPLFYMVFGAEYFELETNEFGSMKPLDIFLQNIVPIVITVIFWTVYKATPGKMILGCQIVNADTGEKLGVGRSIARYIGYFISTIPLGLGFLWIVFDKKNQGWHDKIAGTVVIRSQSK